MDLLLAEEKPVNESKGSFMDSTRRATNLSASQY